MTTVPPTSPAPYKFRKTDRIIGNRQLTRTANHLRKETALKFGVRIRFVSLGSCLKQAQGKGIRNKDVYGCDLGGKYSKINEFLLSAECPVNFTVEDVVAGTGCTVKDAVATVGYLREKGVVRKPYGYYIVSIERRPYLTSL